MKTLSETKEGSIVVVKHLGCGMGLNTRLCDLGVYKGTKVKVVKNSFHGPVIINVLNSKLALGRGQADKIIVE